MKSEEKPQRPPVLMSFTEVKPHLYLSGFGCITEKAIHDHGITHAVDATNIPNNKRLSSLKYFNVPVADDLLSKINKYFYEVANFVDSAKSEGGKCLVYCAAGVSRSACLVLIYLLLRENMTLRDAYYYLNQKRPIIAPNINFWRQMIAAAEVEKGAATVKLITGRLSKPIPDVYLHRAVKMPEQIQKYEKKKSGFCTESESTPTIENDTKEVEVKEGEEENE